MTIAAPTRILREEDIPNNQNAKLEEFMEDGRNIDKIRTDRERRERRVGIYQ